MRGALFNEKGAFQELSPDRLKYPSSFPKYLLHPGGFTGTYNRRR